MNLPNLERIVETHVAVRSLEPAEYLAQLRDEVCAPLRALQSEGSIRWFSFLLHTRQQLTPPLEDEGYIIHLRLEPSVELDTAEFGQLLPIEFLDPHQVPPLPAIIPGAPSRLSNGDSANEWKMLGECSQWILELLESYETGPEPGEIVQYLHFLTNPLMLGHQSVFLPLSQTF